jgi:hypothetical protein
VDVIDEKVEYLFNNNIRFYSCSLAAGDLRALYGRIKRRRDYNVVPPAFLFKSRAICVLVTLMLP